MSTLVSRLDQLVAELSIAGDTDQEIIDLLVEAATEIQRLNAMIVELIMNDMSE